MADQPIEHVQRSQPPWRRDASLLTQCGRPSDECAVITRDVLLAKVKKLGQQRASFSTCMTCWSKCRHDDAWDADPVTCLLREAERHEMAAQVLRWHPGDAENNARMGAARRFRDELLAIAILVDAHRDEFDSLVAGLGGAVRLDQVRARRAGGGSRG